MDDLRREQIKEYYSKMTIDNGGEMVTHTCSCSADSIPKYIKAIVAELPDEITSRYYGCGSPLPLALDGCTVVDLGCGTGQDVYVASKLVGENGKVIGVDMIRDSVFGKEILTRASIQRSR